MDRRLPLAILYWAVPVYAHHRFARCPDRFAALRHPRCLVRAGCGRHRQPAPADADRLARLPGHLRLAGADGAAGRGPRRWCSGGDGEPVRVSRTALAVLGAAVADGHAGLRVGLCLYRFPAIRGGRAEHAARLVPRLAHGCARLAGGGVHVCLHALSLCLPAGAQCALRARHAPDGGCPHAGHAAIRTHPARGLAAGASGPGGRGGAGAHGNAGRLRCLGLLRPDHFHHRHLQGLGCIG